MKPSNLNESELERMYIDERLPAQEIAKIMGVTTTTVTRYLKMYGIPIRSVSETQKIRNENPEKRNQGSPGESHHNYKHGAYVMRDAHQKLLEREKCAKCGSTEKLVIHHVNEDHYDNHPDNLEVLCSSCHNRLHKSLYWKRTKAGESWNKNQSHPERRKK